MHLHIYKADRPVSTNSPTDRLGESDDWTLHEHTRLSTEHYNIQGECVYVLYIVYTNNENPFSVVPSSDISNHPQNTVLFPETEVNALCKSCQVGRQVGLHLGHHTAVERED